MAEHDQRQGIRAGCNAAAAIGDNPLIQRPDGSKALAQLGRRQEGIGFGIQQMRRGQVDAALDVARPAIGVAATSRMPAAFFLTR